MPPCSSLPLQPLLLRSRRTSASHTSFAIRSTKHTLESLQGKRTSASHTSFTKRHTAWQPRASSAVCLSSLASMNCGGGGGGGEVEGRRHGGSLAGMRHSRGRHDEGRQGKWRAVWHRPADRERAPPPLCSWGQRPSAWASAGSPKHTAARLHSSSGRQERGPVAAACRVPYWLPQLAMRRLEAGRSTHRRWPRKSP